MAGGPLTPRRLGAEALPVLLHQHRPPLSHCHQETDMRSRFYAAFAASAIGMAVPAVYVGKPWLASHRVHASPSRPNVVLISLDTTRADHLGCYGYPKPTSPNLDRLTARSVRYANAR